MVYKKKKKSNFHVLLIDRM